MRIARDAPRWLKAGADLDTWGPSPRFNKVQIQLQSYSPSAERALVRVYGSQSIAVFHTSLRSDLRYLGRYQDSAPFKGGDFIFSYLEPLFGGISCTDAFTMIGNRSGNAFMTTSGHCGTRTWYTNEIQEYELGHTSTNYYNGFGGSTTVDVQTIRCNCIGRVWGNGGTIYNQSAIKSPSNGDLVTFDGERTGEVHDVKIVNKGPFCATVEGHPDCDLAEGKSSSPICRPGDSGGPVFQRAANSDIYAYGIISAGNSSGTICDFARLDYIAQPYLTDTHLG